MPLRHLFLALLCCLAIAGPARADSLIVEGTEFVLERDDGRVLRSRDLVGARLTVDIGPAGTAEILIEAVERDAGDDTGAVWLHALKARLPGGESFIDMCEPDPDGRRLGFPLAYRGGSWTLTCTSGAEGKCVRFGYHPWLPSAGGMDPAAYHRACIHMMRADYCGNDQPTTRNGTRVNIWDQRGIQSRDPGEAAGNLAFEAAFGPQGAVCLGRVRVPQDTSIEEVVRRCPRLAAIPTGAACSEDIARRLPEALIFVDSDPAGPASARAAAPRQ